MSTNNSIEWTEATWNPVAGCTIVSPGCKNCYAMRMAARLEAMGQAKYAGTTKKVNGLAVWTGKINLDPDALLAPLSWKKPRRVFVNSMSDLFHEGVPFEFILRVYGVMAKAFWHTFQILTKRPERAAEFYEWLGCRTRVYEAAKEFTWPPFAMCWVNQGAGWPEWPLANIWLGTSVERQQEADERIPYLLGCPAAVRFLSCEPLLGAIDLTNVGPEKWDVTRGWKANANNESGWGNTSRIDWVIVGGESGPGARPMVLEWARTLVRQCQAAGVSIFCKQVGTVLARQLGSSDPKGGRMEDWPIDIQIREFPDAHLQGLRAAEAH